MKRSVTRDNSLASPSPRKDARMPDSEHRTDRLPHEHRRARRPETTRRLRRSREAMLGGVCAGIAEFVGVDTTVTRWIFAATIPLSIGTSVIAYLLLWMLLPGPAAEAERER
jgi:phage shock protein PspC (stress-responsive transcriptional regulator)